jgi:hypothetical protein
VTHFDLGSDEVLLDLLSKAIDGADPVPAEAVAAAKAIAGLRDVDAELATLVADTVRDEDMLLFRHDITMVQTGQAADRMISFSTPHITVDVEVEGDGRTVLGVITPAMATDVELEGAGGTATTTSDELGRFRLESGAGGPCRLRVQAHGGAVVTPWITR